MKNTSRKIVLIVALVMLVIGAISLGCGLYGQNIYNVATEMVGCKKPETMSYIMDTALLDEVELARGREEKAMKSFLTGPLALSAEEVNEVVEQRVAFDSVAVASKEYNNIVAYIMETEGVSQDEAKTLKKDKEKAPVYEQNLLYKLADEEMGLDQAATDTLASDAEYTALYKKGFENLRANNGLKTTLFMKSVTFLFIGIALLVAVGAIAIIMAMDLTAKAKKGGRKANEGLQKFTTFLLNNALFIILLVVLVVVIILRPDFASWDNIMNILKQSSTKGILALGCAGLIVLAGTDLSIGRVLGLSAAVTASLVQAVDYSARMFPQMTQQLPLIIPLLASISVAVVFCLINGFGVAKLNLHAFIITLGTQLIAQGCTCIYIESQPSGTAQALSTFDRNFLAKAAGNLTIGSVKIPLVVLYFLALAVVMWFIWNKTRLGKNMFAVGGNMEAAAVSGVNVAKTIMLVYLIAGVLYGISAFLEAARITSVGANTGINYETDAISACVVGGVSFSGGVGTIPGVVLGAIILQAINYALQFLGVNPYLQYVVRGLIIILAVSIDVRKYIVKK